jgi:RimJ/RimL family protein N-acetyltransferase
MSWLQPVTLRSPRVTLEPLDHRHGDDLALAVKDGGLWTLWYTHIPKPVDAVHHRVEIGSTWYCKSVQRSDLNTQCKLLLLAHAFETLGCIAVEFRTHFFNQQSRKAIERLGAKLDGILRSHQVAPNGSLRDTCVYSIVAGEWPAVKAHLTFQLSRSRAAQ